MEAYQTIDTDKYRINIYVDKDASNPLSLGDEPISLFRYSKYPHSNYYDFDANLPENKEWEKLYFYLDNYGSMFRRSEKSRASGFIATEKETWEKYAGCPYTPEVLEGVYKELEFYYSGEVYGYQVFRKIMVDGQVYLSEEDIDSCWGFYGLADLMEAIEPYTKETEKENV